MQCPETLIGSENYFVALALVVGGLVNVIKRIKWIRVNSVPVIAFGLGWALDAAAGSLLCGLSYTAAGLSGLGAENTEESEGMTQTSFQTFFCVC